MLLHRPRPGAHDGAGLAGPDEQVEVEEHHGSVQASRVGLRRGRERAMNAVRWECWIRTPSLSPRLSRRGREIATGMLGELDLVQELGDQGAGSPGNW